MLHRGSEVKHQTGLYFPMVEVIGGHHVDHQEDYLIEEHHEGQHDHKHFGGVLESPVDALGPVSREHQQPGDVQTGRDDQHQGDQVHVQLLEEQVFRLGADDSDEGQGDGQVYLLTPHHADHQGQQDETQQEHEEGHPPLLDSRRMLYHLRVPVGCPGQVLLRLESHVMEGGLEGGQQSVVLLHLLSERCHVLDQLCDLDVLALALTVDILQ